MFGLKKQVPRQPTGPFAHSDDCKLVKADPASNPSGSRSRRGTGGESANAGPKTSTSHASTHVLGSTH